MSNSEKTPEALDEQLANYLRDSGCRVTAERLLIAQAIRQCPRHFSAEDVFALLESQRQPVTRPTIYSTLRTMVEARMLTTLDIKPDKRLFELKTTEHMHLVCRQCGNIKELRDNTLMRLIRQRRYATFVPDAIDLTLFGICSGCARKKRKK